MCPEHVLSWKLNTVKRGHLTCRVILHAGSSYMQGHLTCRVIPHAWSSYMQGHLTCRVILHAGSSYMQGHPTCRVIFYSNKHSISLRAINQLMFVTVTQCFSEMQKQNTWTHREWRKKSHFKHINYLSTALHLAIKPKTCFPHLKR
jgi:hypothetical protein